MAVITCRSVRVKNPQLLTISSSNDTYASHLDGVDEMFQSKHGEDQNICQKIVFKWRFRKFSGDFLYRKISNISLTKSENLKFPRLAMQLSLCNI